MEAPIQQLLPDEFDPGFQLEDVPRNAIVVHNISAHADFGVPLDLKEVMRCFNNAVYEPQEFNCVRIDVRVRSAFNVSTRKPDSRGYAGIESVPVLDSQKVSVLAPAIARRFAHVPEEHLQKYAEADDYSTMKASVFSNGKVSITGAKSVVAVAMGVEKLCRAIRRRIDNTARVITVIPTNILAVYNFHSHIVLQALEKSCKGAMYDPFRFAGVRLRIPVPSSTNITYNVRNLILTALCKPIGKAAPTWDDKDDAEGSDSDTFDESSDDDDNNTSTQPVYLQQDDSSTRSSVTETPVVGTRKPSSTAGMGRHRKMKKHLHRFLSEVIPSNKRKIHKGMVAAVPQPAPRRQKDTTNKTDTRVWLNGQKGEGEDSGALKEEVVTVNVYTSGNVTFTGARSIASIQYALSYIHPYLVATTASNVLQ